MGLIMIKVNSTKQGSYPVNSSAIKKTGGFFGKAELFRMPAFRLQLQVKEDDGGWQ